MLPNMLLNMLLLRNYFKATIKKNEKGDITLIQMSLGYIFNIKPVPPTKGLKSFCLIILTYYACEVLPPFLISMLLYDNN